MSCTAKHSRQKGQHFLCTCTHTPMTDSLDTAVYASGNALSPLRTTGGLLAVSVSAQGSAVVREKARKRVGSSFVSPFI